MFISESIHNVTKVEIEKRSLGGDPDSVILDTGSTRDQRAGTLFERKVCS